MTVADGRFTSASFSAVRSGNSCFSASSFGASLTAL
jgi:hypothetical protein